MANAQSKEDAPREKAPAARVPVHSSTGLTPTQKYALLGGAVVLLVVLGLSLFSSPGTDPKPFTNYLYSSNQSGILMDVRGSPSPNVSQKILQCGVNLISSGFYARTSKDLLVYACDDSGCLSGGATANQTVNSSATISFSDALYAMRGRPYFYIHYGPSGLQSFHLTYAEALINADSNTSACSIGVQTGPKN